MVKREETLNGAGFFSSSFFFFDEHVIIIYMYIKGKYDPCG